MDTLPLPKRTSNSVGSAMRCEESTEDEDSLGLRPFKSCSSFIFKSVSVMSLSLHTKNNDQCAFSRIIILFLMFHQILKRHQEHQRNYQRISLFSKDSPSGSAFAKSNGKLHTGNALCIISGASMHFPVIS